MIVSMVFQGLHQSRLFVSIQATLSCFRGAGAFNQGDWIFWKVNSPGFSRFRDG